MHIDSSDGLETSIIIPTYNRRAMVERAIRSVLAAVREGDEILVIDDESSDGTEPVVSAFGPPVRYIRQSHGGVCRARNRGLREATRPLVALLDSDDLWTADKLLLQRQVMRQWPNLVFCFSDMGQRLPDGGENPRWLRQFTGQKRPWEELFGSAVAFSSLGELPPGREDFSVHVGAVYRALLDWPYAWVQSLLVRRSRLGAIEFPEDQAFFEDWEFTARLSRLGEAAFLDCVTFWQCQHDGPRQTDISLHERAVCRLRMLARVWGKDEAFLRAHEHAFNEVVAQQHLLLGRRALKEGRLEEARAELQQAGCGIHAIAYRLIASVPPQLVQGLRTLKRLARPSALH